MGSAPMAWAAPDVVASIRPIHSIVASVMAGVGVPKLLLTSAASPHDASLKPSQARMMDQADLVVWVGPELETFLKKSLAGNPVALQAMDEEEGEDEHHDEEEEKEGEEGDHHHHGEDPHVWLDPHAAEELAAKVAERLGQIDPANAALYKANAKTLGDQIEAWEEATAKAMKPLAKTSYIVVHDAYASFAEHFKLQDALPLSAGDDQKPGAARIRELQREIDAKDITCLMREPDSSAAMLETLSQGRTMKLVTLDPLGRDMEAGPDLYLALMNRVQATFSECLTKS